MDFAEVINALLEHMDGQDWALCGMNGFPNLKGFTKQETGHPLLPIEYVQQFGDGDYGHYGTIYFPTTYPNGDGGVMHICVKFSD